MPERESADRLILLGVLGRPHGVRGLLRVTSHTADPMALTAYGPLRAADGRRFALEWRGEGVVAVAELGGGAPVPVPVPVTDRDAAARLTNTELFIERDRLPAPDADEFYLADLIGLQAADTAGSVLGRVAAVHDYGAGVSLEIARDGGAAPLLLPFNRATVPQVALAAGRIVVVPPAEIDAAEIDAAGVAAA